MLKSKATIISFVLGVLIVASCSSSESQSGSMEIIIPNVDEPKEIIDISPITEMLEAEDFIIKGLVDELFISDDQTECIFGDKVEDKEIIEFFSSGEKFVKYEECELDNEMFLLSSDIVTRLILDKEILGLMSKGELECSQLLGGEDLRLGYNSVLHGDFINSCISDMKRFAEISEPIAKESYSMEGSFDQKEYSRCIAEWDTSSQLFTPRDLIISCALIGSTDNNSASILSMKSCMLSENNSMRLALPSVDILEECGVSDDDWSLLFVDQLRIMTDGSFSGECVIDNPTEGSIANKSIGYMAACFYEPFIDQPDETSCREGINSSLDFLSGLIELDMQSEEVGSAVDLTCSKYS